MANYEDRLEKLSAKATPAPWAPYGMPHLCCDCGNEVADADLVLAQRNTLPEVITALRAARQTHHLLDAMKGGCPFCEYYEGAGVKLCWLADSLAALDAVLEKALIHECSFAPNPFDKRIDYCQFCGKMRASKPQPGGEPR